MKIFKISILFALFQASLIAAFGQNVVAEMPVIASDTSIVRFWKGGYNIIYSHNSGNENWFILVDASADFGAAHLSM